jgi:hypothetical protein
MRTSNMAQMILFNGLSPSLLAIVTWPQFPFAHALVIQWKSCGGHLHLTPSNPVPQLSSLVSASLVNNCTKSSMMPLQSTLHSPTYF